MVGSNPLAGIEVFGSIAAKAGKVSTPTRSNPLAGIEVFGRFKYEDALVIAEAE